MASITLHHLTLDPIPLSSIPAVDSAEYASLTTQLLSEASALFSSELWTASRVWSDGLVTTSSLPLGTTLHLPTDAEQLPAVDAPKGFWGSSAKPAKKVDDGLAWHRRTSTLQSGQNGVGFVQFWDALTEGRCEKEVRNLGRGAGSRELTRFAWSDWLCSYTSERRRVAE